MKKKEASARIKINRLLEEAGWRFFDDENGPANIQLEPNVKMSKADLTGLGENFDKVKNGFVDFLLLDDKGKPFIVLEAKAEDKDPLVGKEQAREYAKSLYLKYVILSNGNQHYFWNIYKGNPQLITAFPSYESIRESKAMNADPAKLYSEEIGEDYIAVIKNPRYMEAPEYINPVKQLFANGITNQFLSYVLTLRSKIQDEILSICFSENGFNETLWLKYADMHKGFCLMYDLSDANSSHCGKLDKCANCGVYKYGTRIYPVYYSNTPHDATNFAKFVMGQDMVQQLHVPLPDFMQEELKPLPWEVERNSLIKKECHKYDEEWRMLANCKMNLPAMIECVPAGVIIGLRTPPVDKNLIISMAKEAGVKNIYQSYIDEKNRLNAYLLTDV